jgi:hypothetical protein
MTARPTIVAIHQPNYAPWLGYFYKVARSDIFVFLDDAQFTKNSFINRVQIASEGKPRWLTIPVAYRFGDPIAQVRPAKSTWKRSHIDTLSQCHKAAEHFKSVWTDICAIYEELPDGNLAVCNRALIEAISNRLRLRVRFVASSDYTIEGKGGDRLAGLVSALSPNAVYLSGRGGQKYQSEEVFEAAGIELRYTDFRHPTYDQGRPEFLAGLSILDAIFHLGWDRTAALLKQASPG